MRQFDVLNYGRPIEIVGGRTHRPSGRTCITLGWAKRRKGDRANEYLRMTVSSDIAKTFGGQKLEIVSLGSAFAIVPDNNGRFRLSGCTICGANTATYEIIRNTFKDALDEWDKVDAVKVNNAYIFPHVPIVEDSE